LDKLAIAVTVLGVCVVLPSLSPAFMSAVATVPANFEFVDFFGNFLVWKTG
jgi:hypothetical protein